MTLAILLVLEAAQLALIASLLWKVGEKQDELAYLTLPPPALPPPNFVDPLDPPKEELTQDLHTEECDTKDLHTEDLHTEDLKVLIEHETELHDLSKIRADLAAELFRDSIDLMIEEEIVRPDLKPKTDYAFIRRRA